MSGPNVMYMSLDYETYKSIEEQCKAFPETVHTSHEGFYHVSFRLKIGADLIMEFHGPQVKAAEEEAKPVLPEWGSNTLP